MYDEIVCWTLLPYKHNGTNAVAPGQSFEQMRSFVLGSRSATVDGLPLS